MKIHLSEESIFDSSFKEYDRSSTEITFSGIRQYVHYRLNQWRTHNRQPQQPASLDPIPCTEEIAPSPSRQV
ncbi:hypothetical protein ACQ4M4_06545 [Leptolyngbya sp. AN02str]|uniref:hypothetical protein n=1 Tax=Leptolyngbya sp. AN02str TaxID=3423363 RepID=UPI003D31784B